MVNFLIIYGVFLFLLILGLGSYAIFIFFYKKPTEPRELSFVFNFMSNYAKSAYGMVTKITKGKYRDCIEFIPKDINYLNYYKRKSGTVVIPEIEPKKVWVERDKILSITGGMLSPHKNILIVLPPNAEDFPEEFKQHPLGKTMMKMTEEINTKKLEVEIIREGSDRRSALLKRIGDGEISEQALNQLVEIHEMGLKASLKEKDTKKDFNARPFGLT